MNRPKSNAGRNKVLDKAFIAKVRPLVAMGLPVKTICDYARVSDKSWYSWLQQARDFLEQQTDEDTAIISPSMAINIEFLDMVKSAKAEGIAFNIAVIQNAAKQKDWKAAAQMLKWQDGATFGDKQDINVNMKRVQIIDSYAAEAESNEQGE